MVTKCNHNPLDIRFKKCDAFKPVVLWVILKQQNQLQELGRDNLCSQTPAGAFLKKKKKLVIPFGDTNGAETTHFPFKYSSFLYYL